MVILTFVCGQKQIEEYWMGRRRIVLPVFDFVVVKECYLALRVVQFCLTTPLVLPSM